MPMVKFRWPDKILPPAASALLLYYLYFFYTYFSSVEFIQQTSLYKTSATTVWILTGACWLGILLCLAVIGKMYVRLFTLLIYALSVVLINTNFLLIQLHYYYLSVCLLHLAFFPKKESENLIFYGREIDSRYVLGFFFNATVTISGLSKCFLEGWFNGSTLRFIFSRPFAVNSFLGLKTLDTNILIVCSVIILLMEILTLPLFIFKKTRILSWWLNMLLHIGIFTLMPDIRNISVAMMIVFFYIYKKSLYQRQ